MSEIVIDDASTSVAHLRIFRDENQLATATGFYYSKGLETCLITAWHCLTGVNPLTGCSLSKTGARPNRIVVAVQSHNPNLHYDLSLDLYDHNDRPYWFVHPRGPSDIDIAGLILPALELPERFFSCVNEITESDISIAVGSEVFVVGYPLNVKVAQLPIWKRASLASEPGLTAHGIGEPYYIIDTATREGMSGSPVFARVIGQYMSVQGHTLVGNGSLRRFLGLYAGRIAANDDLAAQLGRVFPAELVHEAVMVGQRAIDLRTQAI